MSPEKRHRQIPPEVLVWRKLVRAQQKGKTLNEKEQRALALRQTCLSIADAVIEITDNLALSDNHVHQAEVVAKYWDNLLKLDEMGITATMPARKSEELSDPLLMAEHVAIQWMRIRNTDVPTARQARLLMGEVAEFRQGEYATVERQFFTPKFENWMQMRSFYNLTHRFLASELDEPKN